MPEGNINIEVAEHLREHGEHAGESGPSRRRIEIIEILEAVLLAIVALATAVSGYQAARWDGESSRAYATSSRLRVEAEQASLTSNQYLAYNAGNVTAWLQAATSGNAELADILANRFTEEYKPAFEAWLKTDPLTNPDAPAGPGEMPQFFDPRAEEAAVMAKEAHAAFEEGVTSRETGEHYVRLTVILAAVLFLIAIGQRFTIRRVRYAVNIVAGVFLVYCIMLIATYPHA
ncbi:MAG TPA: hypothetical protein VFH93_09395 [Thermoleophilia bacterium]|nr:hypothetical protein [Thermoleophilia bacterium]